MKRVAILGGAGYVGSALTPYLLSRGYRVKVIDRFYFGARCLEAAREFRGFSEVLADIRDADAMERELAGMDAVIHLACVSNDPSFELDPELGRSINYDAFPGILKAVAKSGARRFLYASSSSVYGVSDLPEVREDSSCAPLTDYSKYKLLCEELLRSADLGDARWVILRPATVCGFAPRLRLDLTVNLLTIRALEESRIIVHGGAQRRPNIHIRDMIEAYRVLLEAPSDRVAGETFNVGGENKTVSEIADRVRLEIGPDSVRIEVQAVTDARSYHINSEKILEWLGFKPNLGISAAIGDLREAYRAGWMIDPLENPLYYNVRRMREILESEELAAVHG